MKKQNISVQVFKLESVMVRFSNLDKHMSQLQS